MKIFSETSVNLTISMASHFYGNFGHCRSFIILNRKNFSSGAILCKRSREKRQEGERAKSRDILAIEAHWWKSWNTHIFSHWDARNWLDSLTQDTKQCSKFMNWKWHHKFAKHNTTPQHVYQSIFKIFAKFFLLFPHSQLLTVQVPLFLFPVVWSGLYWFPGSLALWLCGPLALCLLLTVCLQVHVLSSGSICLVLVPWFP